MDSYRVVRRSTPQTEFGVLWRGVTIPETDVIDMLCLDERMRLDEGARDPFLQRKTDYILLQQRRKLLGWRTVRHLHIYE